VTDEPALRAAVLARPDDDTPRLVYADWCDDAGDAERGAFIRAQIDAARAEPWSPAQREAEARAAAYRPAALREWEEVSGTMFRTPEFVRGFVEGVEQYPMDLPAGLTALCESNPIRGLRLMSDLDAHDDLDRLLDQFELPILTRIRRLDLRGFESWTPFVFDAVTRSAPLDQLNDLDLACRYLEPQSLEKFLRESSLPALTALDVSDIPNLGPALANGLAAAKHRALAKVNFSGVRFLSRELRELLRSPALAAVEELRLGWPYPGDGPATLVNVGWLLRWAKLRLLDLAGQGLGEDGVREVIDRREAAGLRWLGLARNHLGDGGARRLIESRHLNLYHLDVTGNDVSPPLLAALRARFPDAVVVG
jgi:uncharacterized protein (TIGR02996 family)